MVIRDEVLPCAFGQGTVSSRGTTPPETRRTGLAFEVGNHSGMCLCQSLRRFLRCGVLVVPAMRWLVTTAMMVSLLDGVLRFCVCCNDLVTDSSIAVCKKKGEWLPECAVMAGARVSTNIMVRDMDFAVPIPGDSRRIEVLADGLALFGGVQHAIDTTLVSPLHADGSARPGAAQNDGVAMPRLAGEVGGDPMKLAHPAPGAVHVQNHLRFANGWSKLGDSGGGP